ncbi:SpoIIE family protein phosphatase [Klenkia sp. PcliD-1-E]|uniref:SpoIIE family protein phosphatase n=1 Tax=Klenkia sp. PcliD-1-E TaxID=2954492 RepID=UPI00209771D3|nr:SpoIIE family protein phosphatase [Klenkia sp. PcliD-1-E]MCO7221477.1 SpoIIE family protein phosphatase [Klenkia sp. PcliD-1-E]
MTTTRGDGSDRVVLQARLAVATAAAGLGLWDWDLVTDELVWDDRSRAIFGLTGVELSGTVADIDLAIHPDDRPVVQGALDEAIVGGDLLDVEFRVVHPDGAVRWVAALGRVLPDDTGAPVRMVGTNVDVTDGREAAQQQFADATRMAGLVRVAEELGGTETVGAALAVVTRHASQALGTTGVILCLTDDDGSAVTTYVDAPLDAETVDTVRRLPAGFPLPMVDSAVHGRAHFVPDLEAAAAQFPGGVGIWRRSGVRSGCSVPLRSARRLIGSLALGHRVDRHWRPADREFVGALGALTAQTLTRIASTEAAAAAASAVARLAETLQRSLLTAPPEPDHLHVVPRYLPAAAEAQVGGDWYDAFLGPDGATHLVIGDVTGHDREAAAAMGQLRNVLRGIVWASGGAPAEVLTTLDRAVTGLDVGTLATVLVARVEQVPGGRLLRWSNAGHPAPLLVDADGEVVLLEGRDLLLGVDHTAPRHDHEVPLAPGSTLLLHTDGLVERRGSDLDAGTARLVQTVGRLVRAGVGLDELCDRVLATVPRHPEDDVALIALRAHAEDLPRPREAGPAVVPEVPSPAG